jgi:hypothetical protein
LRDLEDLIAHPGWKLVEIMVDREWGAQGFGEKVAATIGQMTPEATDLAIHHLREATVTQREVQRIMRWPRLMLSAAKQRAGVDQRGLPSLNRGGA